MTNEHGLGRKVQFDERSRQYPIRTLLPPEPLVRKTWRRPLALDQGNTNECVGYSAWGTVNSQPTTKLVPFDTRRQYSPTDIYHGAQTLDPWEGESYEGSSVLAGAKWLKQQGVISEYRWCFGAEDVLQTLAYQGPVVIGISWYNSMFTQTDIDPGRTAYKLDVNLDSGLAGGHAVELHGIRPDKSLVVGTNSWGPSWGDEGRFYLDFTDLATLLADYGEAVTYIS